MGDEELPPNWKDIVKVQVTQYGNQQKFWQSNDARTPEDWKDLALEEIRAHQKSMMYWQKMLGGGKTPDVAPPAPESVVSPAAVARRERSGSIPLPLRRTGSTMSSSLSHHHHHQLPLCELQSMVRREAVRKGVDETIRKALNASRLAVKSLHRHLAMHHTRLLAADAVLEFRRLGAIKYSPLPNCMDPDEYMPYLISLVNTLRARPHLLLHRIPTYLKELPNSERVVKASEAASQEVMTEIAVEQMETFEMDTNMAVHHQETARNTVIRCETWNATRALATFCASSLCRNAIDSEEQKRLLHILQMAVGMESTRASLTEMMRNDDSFSGHLMDVIIRIYGGVQYLSSVLGKHMFPFLEAFADQSNIRSADIMTNTALAILDSLIGAQSQLPILIAVCIHKLSQPVDDQPVESTNIAAAALFRMVLSAIRKPLIWGLAEAEPTPLQERALKELAITVLTIGQKKKGNFVLWASNIAGAPPPHAGILPIEDVEAMTYTSGDVFAVVIDTLRSHDLNLEDLQGLVNGIDMEEIKRCGLVGVPVVLHHETAKRPATAGFQAYEMAASTLESTLCNPLLPVADSTQSITSFLRQQYAFAKATGQTSLELLIQGTALAFPFPVLESSISTMRTSSSFSQLSSEPSSLLSPSHSSASLNTTLSSPTPSPILQQRLVLMSEAAQHESQIVAAILHGLETRDASRDLARKQCESLIIHRDHLTAAVANAAFGASIGLKATVNVFVREMLEEIYVSHKADVQTIEKILEALRTEWRCEGSEADAQTADLVCEPCSRVIMEQQSELFQFIEETVIPPMRRATIFPYLSRARFGEEDVFHSSVPSVPPGLRVGAYTDGNALAVAIEIAKELLVEKFAKWIFTPCNSDVALQDSLSSLSPSLPNEHPVLWERVDFELTNVTSSISPFATMRGIMQVWDGVMAIFSIGGGVPGADNYVPAIAQAIARCKPVNIVTSVAMAERYACEDASDEYWLTHFKVALASTWQGAMEQSLKKVLNDF